MTLGPFCFLLPFSPLAFFHDGSACSSFSAVFQVIVKIQGHHLIPCYDQLFSPSRVSPPRAVVEADTEVEAMVEVEVKVIFLS